MESFTKNGKAKKLLYDLGMNLQKTSGLLEMIRFPISRLIPVMTFLKDFSSCFTFPAGFVAQRYASRVPSTRFGRPASFPVSQHSGEIIQPDSGEIRKICKEKAVTTSLIQNYANTHTHTECLSLFLLHCLVVELVGFQNKLLQINSRHRSALGRLGSETSCSKRKQMLRQKW